MNSIETSSHVGAPYEEESPEKSNQALEDSFVYAICGPSETDQESLDQVAPIDKNDLDGFMTSLKSSSPEDFNRMNEIFDRRQRNAVTPDDAMYVKTAAKGFVEWKENNS